MTVRIRQLALVATELEPTVKQLCATLGADVCFRDPGVHQFGLSNAVMALGDTFLEVVSPLRDGTTAGRLLQRRGGDGGYMVLLQTDDLNRDRLRFERLSVRVIWGSEFDDMRAVHLHPKDVGAAILSFDEPTPAESWRWGGPHWREQPRPARVTAIVGAELQSANPAALAARWSAVLDEPARALEDGSWRIAVQGGELRFVRDADGRGEGLSAVVVRRAQGVAIHDQLLCGTRFRFVA